MSNNVAFQDTDLATPPKTTIVETFDTGTAARQVVSIGALGTAGTQTIVGATLPISGSVTIATGSFTIGTVIATQATAANLNATVVQTTAANLNATVVQATAANLNVTAVQTTAANLNVQAVLATGANFVGNVGAKTVSVTVNPTVTTANAYGTNFVVGGLLTFSNMFTNTGTGLIQSVTVTMNHAETNGFTFFPINANP